MEGAYLAGRKYGRKDKDEEGGVRKKVLFWFSIKKKRNED